MSNPFAPPSSSGRGADPPPRGSPTPGGGPPPQGRPPGPPARPRRPAATPEQIRTAARRAFAAAACTVGALLATGLPLPGPALGAALAVAGVVLGIRALVAAAATGQHRTLLPVIVVGLVVSLFSLVSAASLIATWPIQQERQACMARALTVSARDACEADYQRAVEELTSGRP